jgi:hypothetical protein
VDEKNRKAEKVRRRIMIMLLNMRWTRAVVNGLNQIAIVRGVSYVLIHTDDIDITSIDDEAYGVDEENY